MDESLRAAAAQQWAAARVIQTVEWTHAYGLMLIQTRADGSVWIDGKPVPETLPGATIGLGGPGSEGRDGSPA